MIKLIFRQNGQFLLSFLLDSEGNVSEIVGQDDWFDYRQQIGSIGRRDPEAWVDLLQAEYRDSSIELLVEEIEPPRRPWRKILLLLFLLLLLLTGVFLFLNRPVDLDSNAVLDNSSEALELALRDKSGTWIVELDKRQIGGSFARGAVTIKSQNPELSKTWKEKILVRKTATGSSREPITSRNDFLVPFRFLIDQAIPEVDQFQTVTAKSRLTESTIELRGRTRLPTALFRVGSRYRLILDKDSYRPLEIEIIDPSRPLGRIADRLRISFRYR